MTLHQTIAESCTTTPTCACRAQEPGFQMSAHMSASKELCVPHEMGLKAQGWASHGYLSPPHVGIAEHCSTT